MVRIDAQLFPRPVNVLDGILPAGFTKTCKNFSSFRTRMVYEQKKDYFSFSEPLYTAFVQPYTTFDSQSEEQER